MNRGDHTSRRRLLRAGAGALAGLGFVGGASGERTVRANVGYRGASGLAAVRERAADVVWEFSFDAVTVELPASATAALADRSDVRYVEADPPMATVGDGGGVTGQTLPWGVDRVDAEAAWRAGRGRGADVAVVDTGIDLTHADLPTVERGVSTIGGVVAPGGQDDDGHGTHCAGVVAAADDGGGVVGVAPRATLRPVKAIPAGGTGFTSDVARGVDLVRERGWDVASMSLGSSTDSAVMREACQHASDAGVLLVAAAGNGGGAVQYPARYPTVLAVSATDRSDRLAGFSARGAAVDLAAPGDRVYSTSLGGYLTRSGTSMAAPHVAGAGALLIGRGASAGSARAGLLDSAEDLGLPAAHQGRGLLDAAAAVGTAGDDLGDGSTSGLGGSGIGVGTGLDPGTGA